MFWDNEVLLLRQSIRPCICHYRREREGLLCRLGLGGSLQGRSFIRGISIDEFTKRQLIPWICHPVDFKNMLWCMTLFHQFPCRMSLRPKRPDVILLICRVKGHSRGEGHWLRPYLSCRSSLSKAQMPRLEVCRHSYISYDQGKNTQFPLFGQGVTR